MHAGRGFDRHEMRLTSEGLALVSQLALHCREDCCRVYSWQAGSEGVDSVRQPTALLSLPLPELCVCVCATRQRHICYCVCVCVRARATRQRTHTCDDHTHMRHATCSSADMEVTCPARAATTDTSTSTSTYSTHESHATSDTHLQLGRHGGDVPRQGRHYRHIYIYIYI